MDTRDDAPPAGLVEDKTIADACEAESPKLAELRARLEAVTPDHALPQVFSEQHG